MADPVGGNLKAVFKECDEPTDEDYNPEWGRLELQMAIPRESHEDVGNREKNGGFHGEQEEISGNRGAGLGIILLLGALEVKTES